MVCAVGVYAQSDVTKFLGIPVDGFKDEMISKLKAKGFRSTERDKDVLEGEFNGYNVNVRVVTNNNKVYRIVVVDVNNVSENDIRIRFNNLCRQFENNSKYTPLSENYIIPDNEDISYEMSVKNKRYEASFSQFHGITDSVVLAEKIKVRYSLSDDRYIKSYESYKKFYSIEKKYENAVWFLIREIYGKYYICMYYDNECNRAKGEDL